MSGEFIQEKIAVPDTVLERIVGEHGVGLEHISKETGTNVTVGAAMGQNHLILISGSPGNVDNAKSFIGSLIEGLQAAEFDDWKMAEATSATEKDKTMQEGCKAHGPETQTTDSLDSHPHTAPELTKGNPPHASRRKSNGKNWEDDFSWAWAYNKDNKEEKEEKSFIKRWLQNIIGSPLESIPGQTNKSEDEEKEEEHPRENHSPDAKSPSNQNDSSQTSNKSKKGGELNTTSSQFCVDSVHDQHSQTPSSVTTSKASATPKATPDTGQIVVSGIELHTTTQTGDTSFIKNDGKSLDLAMTSQEKQNSGNIILSTEGESVRDQPKKEATIPSSNTIGGAYTHQTMQDEEYFGNNKSLRDALRYSSSVDYLNKVGQNDEVNWEISNSGQLTYSSSVDYIDKIGEDNEMSGGLSNYDKRMYGSSVDVSDQTDALIAKSNQNDQRTEYGQGQSSALGQNKFAANLNKEYGLSSSVDDLSIYKSAPLQTSIASPHQQNSNSTSSGNLQKVNDFTNIQHRLNRTFSSSVDDINEFVRINSAKDSPIDELDVTMEVDKRDTDIDEAEGTSVDKTDNESPPTSINTNTRDGVRDDRIQMDSMRTIALAGLGLAIELTAGSFPVLSGSSVDGTCDPKPVETVSIVNKDECDSPPFGLSFDENEGNVEVSSSHNDDHSVNVNMHRESEDDLSIQLKSVSANIDDAAHNIPKETSDKEKASEKDQSTKDKGPLETSKIDGIENTGTAEHVTTDGASLEYSTQHAAQEGSLQLSRNETAKTNHVANRAELDTSKLSDIDSGIIEVPKNTKNIKMATDEVPIYNENIEKSLEVSIDAENVQSTTSAASTDTVKAGGEAPTNTENSANQGIETETNEEETDIHGTKIEKYGVSKDTEPVKKATEEVPADTEYAKMMQDLSQKENENTEDRTEEVPTDTENIEKATEEVLTETENIEKATEEVSTETESIEKAIEGVPTDTENIEKAAEEVPTDAENIEKATEEVQMDTENIEKATEEVSTDTENIEKATEEVPTDAENIEKATEEVQMDTENIENATEEVSTDTENIEKATEEVPTDTENIEKAAEEVSTDTENIEKATEEVSTDTENIEKAAEEVSTDTENIEKAAEDVPTDTENIEKATEEVPTDAENIEKATEEVQMDTENIENATEEVSTDTENIEKATEEVPTDTENIEKAAEEVSTDTENIEKATEEVSTDTENIEKAAEEVSTDTENIEKAAEDVPTDTENIEKTAEQMSTDTENIEKAAEEVPTETKSIEKAIEGVPTDTENIEKATEEVSTDTENIEKAAEEVPTETKSIEKAIEGVPTDTENIEKATEDVPTDTEIIDKAAEEVQMDTENIEKATEEVQADTENTENATEEVQIDAENIEKATEEVSTDTENIEKATEEVQADTENTENATEEVQIDAENIEKATEEVSKDTENIEKATEEVSTDTENIEKATEEVSTDTENIEKAAEEFSTDTENIEKATEEVQMDTESIEKGAEDVPTDTEIIEKAAEEVQMDTENIEKAAEEVSTDTENIEKAAEDLPTDTENIEKATEEVSMDTDNSEKAAEDVPTDAENIEKATEEVQMDTENIEKATEEVSTDTENIEKATEEVQADTENTENATEEVQIDAENIEKMTEEVSTDTENIEKATEEVSTDTENIEKAAEEAQMDTENIEKAAEEVPTDTENIGKATEDVPTDTENIEKATEEVQMDTENIEKATEVATDKENIENITENSNEKHVDDVSEHLGTQDTIGNLARDQIDTLLLHKQSVSHIQYLLSATIDCPWSIDSTTGKLHTDCHDQNRNTTVEQHFLVRLMRDQRPDTVQMQKPDDIISRFVDAKERPAIFTKNTALLAKKNVRHLTSCERATKFLKRQSTVFINVKLPSSESVTKNVQEETCIEKGSGAHKFTATYEHDINDKHSTLHQSETQQTEEEKSSVLVENKDATDSEKEISQEDLLEEEDGNETQTLNEEPEIVNSDVEESDIEDKEILQVETIEKSILLESQRESIALDDDDIEGDEESRERNTNQVLSPVDDPTFLVRPDSPEPWDDEFIKPILLGDTTLHDNNGLSQLESDPPFEESFDDNDDVDIGVKEHGKGEDENTRLGDDDENMDVVGKDIAEDEVSKLLDDPTIINRPSSPEAFMDEFIKPILERFQSNTSDASDKSEQIHDDSRQQTLAEDPNIVCSDSEELEQIDTNVLKVDEMEKSVLLDKKEDTLYQTEEEESSVLVENKNVTKNENEISQEDLLEEEDDHETQTLNEEPEIVNSDVEESDIEDKEILQVETIEKSILLESQRESIALDDDDIEGDQESRERNTNQVLSPVDDPTFLVRPDSPEPWDDEFIKPILLGDTTLHDNNGLSQLESDPPFEESFDDNDDVDFGVKGHGKGEDENTRLGDDDEDDDDDDDDTKEIAEDEVSKLLDDPTIINRPSSPEAFMDEFIKPILERFQSNTSDASDKSEQIHDDSRQQTLAEDPNIVCSDSDELEQIDTNVLKVDEMEKSVLLDKKEDTLYQTEEEESSVLIENKDATENENEICQEDLLEEEDGHETQTLNEEPEIVNSDVEESDIEDKEILQVETIEKSILLESQRESIALDDDDIEGDQESRERNTNQVLSPVDDPTFLVRPDSPEPWDDEFIKPILLGDTTLHDNNGLSQLESDPPFEESFDDNDDVDIGVKEHGKGDDESTRLDDDDEDDNGDVDLKEIAEDEVSKLLDDPTIINRPSSPEAFMDEFIKPILERFQSNTSETSDKSEQIHDDSRQQTLAEDPNIVCSDSEELEQIDTNVLKVDEMEKSVLLDKKEDTLYQTEDEESSVLVENKDVTESEKEICQEDLLEEEDGHETQTLNEEPEIVNSDVEESDIEDKDVLQVETIEKSILLESQRESIALDDDDIEGDQESRERNTNQVLSPVDDPTFLVRPDSPEPWDDEFIKPILLGDTTLHDNNGLSQLESDPPFEESFDDNDDVDIGGLKGHGKGDDENARRGDDDEDDDDDVDVKEIAEDEVSKLLDDPTIINRPSSPEAFMDEFIKPILERFQSNTSDASDKSEQIHDDSRQQTLAEDPNIVCSDSEEPEQIDTNVLKVDEMEKSVLLDKKEDTLYQTEDEESSVLVENKDVTENENEISQEDLLEEEDGHETQTLNEEPEIVNSDVEESDIEDKEILQVETIEKSILLESQRESIALDDDDIERDEESRERNTNQVLSPVDDPTFLVRPDSPEPWDDEFIKPILLGDTTLHDNNGLSQLESDPPFEESFDDNDDVDIGVKEHGKGEDENTRLGDDDENVDVGNEMIQDEVSSVLDDPTIINRPSSPEAFMDEFIKPILERFQSNTSDASDKSEQIHDDSRQQTLAEDPNIVCSDSEELEQIDTNVLKVDEMEKSVLLDKKEDTLYQTEDEESSVLVENKDVTESEKEICQEDLLEEEDGHETQTLNEEPEIVNSDVEESDIEDKEILQVETIEKSILLESQRESIALDDDDIEGDQESRERNTNQVLSPVDDPTFLVRPDSPEPWDDEFIKPILLGDTTLHDNNGLSQLESDPPFEESFDDNDDVDIGLNEHGKSNDENTRLGDDDEDDDDVDTKDIAEDEVSKLLDDPTIINRPSSPEAFMDEFIKPILERFQSNTSETSDKSEQIHDDSRQQTLAEDPNIVCSDSEEPEQIDTNVLKVDEMEKSVLLDKKEDTLYQTEDEESSVLVENKDVTESEKEICQEDLLEEEDGHETQTLNEEPEIVNSDVEESDIEDKEILQVETIEKSILLESQRESIALDDDDIEGDEESRERNTNQVLSPVDDPTFLVRPDSPEPWDDEFIKPILLGDTTLHDNNGLSQLESDPPFEESFDDNDDVDIGLNEHGKSNDENTRLGDDDEDDDDVDTKDIAEDEVSKLLDDPTIINRPSSPEAFMDEFIKPILERFQSNTSDASDKSEQIHDDSRQQTLAEDPNIVCSDSEELEQIDTNVLKVDEMEKSVLLDKKEDTLYQTEDEESSVLVENKDATENENEISQEDLLEEEDGHEIQTLNEEPEIVNSDVEESDIEDKEILHVETIEKSILLESQRESIALDDDDIEGDQESRERNTNQVLSPVDDPTFLVRPDSPEPWDDEFIKPILLGDTTLHDNNGLSQLESDPPFEESFDDNDDVDIGGLKEHGKDDDESTRLGDDDEDDDDDRKELAEDEVSKLLDDPTIINRPSSPEAFMDEFIKPILERFQSNTSDASDKSEQIYDDSRQQTLEEDPNIVCSDSEEPEQIDTNVLKVDEMEKSVLLDKKEDTLYQTEDEESSVLVENKDATENENEISQEDLLEEEDGHETQTLNEEPEIVNCDVEESDIEDKEILQVETIEKSILLESQRESIALDDDDIEGDEESRERNTNQVLSPVDDPTFLVRPDSPEPWDDEFIKPILLGDATLHNNGLGQLESDPPFEESFDDNDDVDIGIKGHGKGDDKNTRLGEDDEDDNDDDVDVKEMAEDEVSKLLDDPTIINRPSSPEAFMDEFIKPILERFQSNTSDSSGKSEETHDDSRQQTLAEDPNIVCSDSEELEQIDTNVLKVDEMEKSVLLDKKEDTLYQTEEEESSVLVENKDVTENENEIGQEDLLEEEDGHETQTLNEEPEIVNSDVEESDIEDKEILQVETIEKYILLESQRESITVDEDDSKQQTLAGDSDIVRSDPKETDEEDTKILEVQKMEKSVLLDTPSESLIVEEYCMEEESRKMNHRNSKMNEDNESDAKSQIVSMSDNEQEMAEEGESIVSEEQRALPQDTISGENSSDSAEVEEGQEVTSEELHRVRSMMSALSRRMSCQVEPQDTNDVIDDINVMVDKINEGLQEGTLAASDIIPEMTRLTQLRPGPSDTALDEAERCVRRTEQQIFDLLEEIVLLLQAVNSHKSRDVIVVCDELAHDLEQPDKNNENIEKEIPATGTPQDPGQISTASSREGDAYLGTGSETLVVENSELKMESEGAVSLYIGDSEGKGASRGVCADGKLTVPPTKIRRTSREESMTTSSFFMEATKQEQEVETDRKEEHDLVTGKKKVVFYLRDEEVKKRASVDYEKVGGEPREQRIDVFGLSPSDESKQENREHESCPQEQSVLYRLETLYFVDKDGNRALSDDSTRKTKEVENIYLDYSKEEDEERDSVDCESDEEDPITDGDERNNFGTSDDVEAKEKVESEDIDEEEKEENEDNAKEKIENGDIDKEEEEGSEDVEAKEKVESEDIDKEEREGSEDVEAKEKVESGDTDKEEREGSEDVEAKETVESGDTDKEEREGSEDVGVKETVESGDTDKEEREGSEGVEAKGKAESGDTDKEEREGSEDIGVGEKVESGDTDKEEREGSEDDAKEKVESGDNEKEEKEGSEDTGVEEKVESGDTDEEEKEGSEDVEEKVESGDIEKEEREGSEDVEEKVESGDIDKEEEEGSEDVEEKVESGDTDKEEREGSEDVEAKEKVESGDTDKEEREGSEDIGVEEKVESGDTDKEEREGSEDDAKEKIESGDNEKEEKEGSEDTGVEEKVESGDTDEEEKEGSEDVEEKVESGDIEKEEREGSEDVEEKVESGDIDKEEEEGSEDVEEKVESGDIDKKEGEVSEDVEEKVESGDIDKEEEEGSDDIGVGETVQSEDTEKEANGESEEIKVKKNVESGGIDKKEENESKDNNAKETLEIAKEKSDENDDVDEKEKVESEDFEKEDKDESRKLYVAETIASTKTHVNEEEISRDQSEKEQEEEKGEEGEEKEEETEEGEEETEEGEEKEEETEEGEDETEEEEEEEEEEEGEEEEKVDATEGNNDFKIALKDKKYKIKGEDGKGKGYLEKEEEEKEGGVKEDDGEDDEGEKYDDGSNYGDDEGDEGNDDEEESDIDIKEGETAYVPEIVFPCTFDGTTVKLQTDLAPEQSNQTVRTVEVQGQGESHSLEMSELKRCSPGEDEDLDADDEDGGDDVCKDSNESGSNGQSEKCHSSESESMNGKKLTKSQKRRLRQIRSRTMREQDEQTPHNADGKAATADQTDSSQQSVNSKQSTNREKRPKIKRSQVKQLHDLQQRQQQEKQSKHDQQQQQKQQQKQQEEKQKRDKTQKIQQTQLSGKQQQSQVNPKVSSHRGRDDQKRENKNKQSMTKPSSSSSSFPNKTTTQPIQTPQQNQQQKQHSQTDHKLPSIDISVDTGEIDQYRSPPVLCVESPKEGGACAQTASEEGGVCAIMAPLITFDCEGEREASEAHKEEHHKPDSPLREAALLTIPGGPSGRSRSRSRSQEGRARSKSRGGRSKSRDDRSKSRSRSKSPMCPSLRKLRGDSPRRQGRKHNIVVLEKK